MPAATVQQSLGLLRSSPLEREFERLYQRYVADVYRYALYILRDGPEAEDVTQAAFLNAFRAFQRGERPHKPRSWLLTIVHNECRRHFRTKARRPAEVELDEGLTADLAPDEDVPTPDEIRRALGELSFNQRSALVMRELEGRSYTEIATTLDLSVSAVETLLFRARRALREQLEGALTCGEAELALSKQLDRRLSADEKAGLRAHLRACKECSRLARRQRAQRSALRSLGPVPLPASLTSLFGGGSSGGLLAGGSVLGGGVAFKAAAILAGGAVATGVGLGTASAGGGAGQPAPASVAPMRQAALLPPASHTPDQVTPIARGYAGDDAVGLLLGLGPLGAQLLANDVDAARDDPAGQRTPGGREAGPKGNDPAGSGNRRARRSLLPRTGPVQLPRVSVPAARVSVAAPALPRPSVPKPRVVKPKPATPVIPPVNVPPVVQTPPVQPPPLPPPPKLP